MSAAHTPAPWFCEYGADGYYGLYHNGDVPLDDNIEANELLIAAAPDLLAALISTRASLQAMADEGIVAEGSWPTIDAAIAKATTAIEPNSVGTPQGVDQK